MKVAIQGERGSFSHEVAQKLFGRSVELVACETFVDLFAALRRADAAIVPIENALFGSIHQNFDLLLKHKPQIWGETYHRIELCLIGLERGMPRRGSKVLVHPVAAGQCGAFLKRHGLKIEYAHDTAGSVLGSDAFFPFRDGVDQAAAAGVRAIVQPGGSVRDAEVIAACDEHDIAMVVTGRRTFRH